MMQGFGGSFVPLTRPRNDGGEVLPFAFAAGELLALEGEPALATPAALAAAGIDLGGALCVGELDGRTCVALAVEPCDVPGGLRRLGLRAVYAELGETLFAIAGRAVQVVEWDRGHRYCGRCGGATVRDVHEYARRCPACKVGYYPRIAPAVMVLVHDGRKLILARSPRHAPGQYTAVAGFVEAGETLEEACAREVREEVGVAIRDLRYFASQSWPFPHSLMIAFTARYAGGDLRADGVEIEEAAWFDPGALPRLPQPISIAYRLITATAEGLCAALAGTEA